MYYYTAVFEVKKHPYGSILGSKTNPFRNVDFVEQKFQASTDAEAIKIAQVKSKALAVGNVDCEVKRIFKERHEINKNEN
jgi:hypothetical protein